MHMLIAAWHLFWASTLVSVGARGTTPIGVIFAALGTLGTPAVIWLREGAKAMKDHVGKSALISLAVGGALWIFLIFAVSINSIYNDHMTGRSSIESAANLRTKILDQDATLAADNQTINVLTARLSIANSEVQTLLAPSLPVASQSPKYSTPVPTPAVPCGINITNSENLNISDSSMKGGELLCGSNYTNTTISGTSIDH